VLSGREPFGKLRTGSVAGYFAVSASTSSGQAELRAILGVPLFFQRGFGGVGGFVGIGGRDGGERGVGGSGGDEGGLDVEAEEGGFVGVVVEVEMLGGLALFVGRPVVEGESGVAVGGIDFEAGALAGLEFAEFVAEVAVDLLKSGEGGGLAEAGCGGLEDFVFLAGIEAGVEFCDRFVAGFGGAGENAAEFPDGEADGTGEDQHDDEDFSAHGHEHVAGGKRIEKCSSFQITLATPGGVSNFHQPFPTAPALE
jgi:hypothetical protein